MKKIQLKWAMLSLLMCVFIASGLNAHIPKWFEGYLNFHADQVALQHQDLQGYLEGENVLEPCWERFNQIHSEPHRVPDTPPNYIFVDHWTSQNEKFAIQDAYTDVCRKIVVEKIDGEVEGYLELLRENHTGFRALEEIVNAHYRDFCERKVAEFPAHDLQNIDIDVFHKENADLKTTLVTTLYMNVYEPEKTNCGKVLKSVINNFFDHMCAGCPNPYIEGLRDVVAGIS